MLPSAPTFDAIIERLAPGLEFHQNRYARALDEAIGDGDRWLDLGAGTRIHQGWIGRSEGELAGRCRLVAGCDLEREHLLANKRLSHRACADAGTLPFRDASFDVVSANMVLEHLRDPLPVFREIRRVLVPGGRFVFVTPNLHHPGVRAASLVMPPRLRRVLANRWEGRALEDVFVTYYQANTRSTLGALARGAGMEPHLIEVFSSFPLIQRPWPAVAVEATWLRIQMRVDVLRPLGSNLVGVLRTPDDLPSASGVGGWENRSGSRARDSLTRTREARHIWPRRAKEAR